MKTTYKVVCLMLVLVLVFSTCVFATQEEPVPTEEAVEQAQQENQGEQEEALNQSESFQTVKAKARVIENNGIKEIVSGDATKKVQEIKLEIISGEYIGEEFSTEYNITYDIEGKIETYELKVGTKLLVEIVDSADAGVSILIQDVYRSNHLLGISILFLLSIAVIGGKKGVKTIISLVVTALLVYFILVKGILNGKNAILMAVLTSAAIISVTYILFTGFNKRTFSAILGTIISVLIAGFVSLIFNRLCMLTGAGDDAIQMNINLASINFNFKDILFASIMIGSLGACMDIGLSICNQLSEIKLNEPDITWTDLFKRGLSIGREMIGTMSNTIILVFAGSLLSLIVLYMACGFTFIEIINKETIAEDVIFALSASIGIILSVPVTSFIYSIINKERVIYNKKAQNKVEGRRTLKI